MPRSADAGLIREILETDRCWAVYALADLAPEYRAHARWHVAGGGRRALLLVYSGFDPPVLFAFGAAGDLAPLLPEVADVPAAYLSVREDAAHLVRAFGYETPALKRMWRMVVDPPCFVVCAHAAERLGPADYEAVARLYRDGDAAGEAPPFFDAAMLRHGVYYGIREGADIVAAAGTHVLAEREGVAGIGNVYTRRDRRGRGFAGQATGAVAAELLRSGVRTVVLNVEQGNTAAIRVYERLGFRRYCEYREGIAIRGLARGAC